MFPIIQKPVNWFALQINGVLSKWWRALVVNGLMKCKMVWNWVYTIMYVCVSEGKKCSFFGKFGVLCFLETPVLRFALLPYYRRVVVKDKVVKNFRRVGPSFMFNRSPNLSLRWQSFFNCCLSVPSCAADNEFGFAVPYIKKLILVKTYHFC